MNLRKGLTTAVLLGLAACGDGEPASIGAIHHEVAEVAQVDGRLIVTVRARSGAVEQSYWLPHIAGVARQVLAETSRRWPGKLVNGVIFRAQAAGVDSTGNAVALPALDLAFDGERAKSTNWQKVSDFAVLDGAAAGVIGPAGGRAIRAFCDDPNQAPYAPTFCLRALASGR